MALPVHPAPPTFRHRPSLVPNPPKRSWLACGLVLVLASGLASCDGSDSPSPVDPGPPEEGNVTISGGSVSSDDGQVTLTVPPGAVSSPVQVTITPMEGAAATPGPVAGTAYILEPASTTLALAAQLRIEHAPGAVPADAIPATIQIHRQAAGSGQWTRVENSSWDPGANVATASVSQLGRYAIVFPGLPEEVDATGQEQAGVVGQPTDEAPSVQVRSEFGNPLAGVGVTFAVVEGGGSVGTVATVTGPDGRASAGSWTLGPHPGSQRVEANIESIDDPVVFSAHALAGAPARLVAVAGQGSWGLVGESPASLPVARVEDDQGNGLEGVQVQFEQVEGEGDISPALVVTGPDGLASLTGWTLESPGLHALDATAEGVEEPLRFLASAASGEPTIIGIDMDTWPLNTGSQAFPGDPLDVTPRFVVRGFGGEPIEGAIVRFTPMNEGEVRDTLALTDADGLASPGEWIMGHRGENRLQATVEGLNPATMQVNSLSPCNRAFPAELGEPIMGTLDEDRDCFFIGRTLRYSSIQFTSGGAFSVHTAASPGEGITAVRSAGGDRPLVTMTSSATAHTTPIEVILPPGEAWFGGGGVGSGPYTLQVESVAEPRAQCSSLPAFIAFGASAEGRITNLDCVDNVAEAGRFDAYSVPFQASDEFSIQVRVEVDAPVRVEVWQGRRGTESAERLHLIEEVGPGQPAVFDLARIDGPIGSPEIFIIAPDGPGYRLSVGDPDDG